MKFSTRVNADIPADQLFDKVTDFSRLERLLIRNDVRVSRIDPADEPGAGMAWNLAFGWRGRNQLLRLDVRRFDRPDVMSIDGTSDLFNLSISATVFGLSQKRSRLIFETEVRPRNMRARVILQTARLAKSRLDGRFEHRINALFGGDLAETILPVPGMFHAAPSAVFRSESAG